MRFLVEWYLERLEEKFDREVEQEERQNIELIRKAVRAQDKVEAGTEKLKKLDREINELKQRIDDEKRMKPQRQKEKALAREKVAFRSFMLKLVTTDPETYRLVEPWVWSTADGQAIFGLATLNISVPQMNPRDERVTSRGWETVGAPVVPYRGVFLAALTSKRSINKTALKIGPEVMHYSQNEDLVMFLMRGEHEVVYLENPFRTESYGVHSIQLPMIRPFLQERYLEALGVGGRGGGEWA